MEGYIFHNYLEEIASEAGLHYGGGHNLHFTESLRKIFQLQTVECEDRTQ
jgi:hypothetical protein